MKPEHVRLLTAEKEYGQKNLLHAQLETIALVKHYQKFKEIRNEELVLKIALKSKIDETRAALALLERLLPKPTMHPKETLQQPVLRKSEHTSLEQEIDEIRKKLARLR